MALSTPQQNGSNKSYIFNWEVPIPTDLPFQEDTVLRDSKIFTIEDQSFCFHVRYEKIEFYNYTPRQLAPTSRLDSKNEWLTVSLELEMESDQNTCWFVPKQMPFPHQVLASKDDGESKLMDCTATCDKFGFHVSWQQNTTVSLISSGRGSRKKQQPKTITFQIVVDFYPPSVKNGVRNGVGKGVENAMRHLANLLNSGKGSAMSSSSFEARRFWPTVSSLKEQVPSWLACLKTTRPIQ